MSKESEYSRKFGVTLHLDELDWHVGNENVPMDVPIIAMAPAGNVSIHLGREILSWTKWLMFDEFNVQAEKLIKAKQKEEILYERK